MITVQHIAFNCKDKDAQEAFYTRHFGYRRARVFNAGQPNEFVMLRLGGTRLELFNADSKDFGGEQSIGFKHLAFEVQDIEKAVSELNADGIETDPIKDCSHVLEGLRVCFFNDLEGNRIELMQGYEDHEEDVT